MTLFYNNGYGELNINSFTELGYDLYLLDNESYEFINELKDNDVLFIRLDDIDKINQLVNTNLKLTIFLFISHEYCNEHRRIAIIKHKNPNHRIWFLTSHIDFYSKDNDVSLEARMFPFKEAFSDKVYNNPPHRTTKYNFFNRSINLRRLKIFEILKKKNIELLDCYFTFGNIIKHNTFGGINTIAEFVEFRDNKNKLEIDVEFISKYKDEFKLYENRQDVELGVIQSSHSNDMYDTINEQSLDSFVSMIIESSGDSGDDLRITEKTIRAWLYQNIFLSLQCKGFGRAIRNNGIQTFEDVFNLQSDWDETDSETERIEIFVNALKWFNELSMDEIKKIYNSESVQKRLINNYKVVNGCFNPLNAIMEIDKLISYENNVFK